MIGDNLTKLTKPLFMTTLFYTGRNFQLLCRILYLVEDQIIIVWNMIYNKTSPSFLPMNVLSYASQTTVWRRRMNSEGLHLGLDNGESNKWPTVTHKASQGVVTQHYHSRHASIILSVLRLSADIICQSRLLSHAKQFILDRGGKMQDCSGLAHINTSAPFE